MGTSRRTTEKKAAKQHVIYKRPNCHVNRPLDYPLHRKLAQVALAGAPINDRQGSSGHQDFLGKLLAKNTARGKQEGAWHYDLGALNRRPIKRAKTLQNGVIAPAPHAAPQPEDAVVRLSTQFGKATITFQDGYHYNRNLKLMTALESAITFIHEVLTDLTKWVAATQQPNIIQATITGSRLPRDLQSDGKELYAIATFLRDGRPDWDMNDLAPWFFGDIEDPLQSLDKLGKSLLDMGCANMIQHQLLSPISALKIQVDRRREAAATGWMGMIIE